MAARHRRGFATLLVLGVIAILAILLAAVEASSMRQAMGGRRDLARVRAYWAARGGIEAQIAALSQNTATPDPGSVYTVADDLAASALGTLDGAAFVVRHSGFERDADGAADAHAKININTMTAEDLILLPDMDQGTAEAILDWIDEDDDVREFGAEEAQYISAEVGYTPRNGPVRSLQELEMILGVRAEFVRGEDWNLNGVLDANENDGSETWPPDNADGRLDAAWSALVTAASEEPLGGGFASTGEPKLDLTAIDAGELIKAIAIDTDQAEAIIEYAGGDGAAMTDFIGTGLNTLAAQSAGSALPTGAQLLGGRQSGPQDLSRDQLRELLDKATIGVGKTLGVRRGRLNINTCEERALEYFAEIDAGVADAIMLERRGRSGGFTSLVDLLDVPSVDAATLAALAERIDVTSTAYVATSRGRDQATGLTVEIVAVLDRGSIPVVVRDLWVR